MLAIMIVIAVAAIIFGNDSQKEAGWNWLGFLGIAWVIFQLIALVMFISYTSQHEDESIQSGIWVQEQGGLPIAQPTNVGEDNTYTLYANLTFGPDTDYTTISDAANAAFSQYGDRPATVSCDELVWETTLTELLVELDKETVFGVPKSSYCINGGSVSVWPAK